MITAVDTNVLLDVFLADSRFGRSSAAAIRHCLQVGALVACPVVWTETATAFPSQSRFLEAMQILEIGFSVISQPAALTAAKAWHSYREGGGKRVRLVADFLIGAHAIVRCQRLLTRDRGFYKQYFSKLNVVEPSTFRS